MLSGGRGQQAKSSADNWVRRWVVLEDGGGLRRGASCQHEETHVLIVDDDPTVRALLRDLLEEAHYQVAEASNGRAALDRLAAATQPTVVLLDQSMPRLTGTEVAAAIAQDQRLARRCACMLLTGSADNIGAASDLPLVAVVGKPFDLDTLLAAVHAAAKRLLSVIAVKGPSTAQRDLAVTPHRTGVTSL